MDHTSWYYFSWIYSIFTLAAILFMAYIWWNLLRVLKSISSSFQDIANVLKKLEA